MLRRTHIAAAGLLAIASMLPACTSSKEQAESATSGDTTQTINVTSTNKACELSTTSAPSGPLVFDVTNKGSQVMEFYLLAADGLRIVGEVENIGPGITRKLVTTAAPGTYVTACKPGMVGKGIRADFTVTDSGTNDVAASGETAELLDAATTQYGAYVRDQSQLLAATEAFVAAYKSGDDATARSTYAPTRMHWERIEPVAESFGDLDPKLDLREAFPPRG